LPLSSHELQVDPGQGMCKNLVEKGNLDKPLVLYNRTKKRADDLAAKLGEGKAMVVETVADVVKNAEIIFICLGEDPSVTAMVDKILQQDVQGKLICDCSTVHPDTSNALEETVTSKGAEFVAMPVFGAPAMADAGQLLCVSAGKATSVKKVLPYTKGVMGRADVDYSDQPAGNATLLKIIGNTFVLNMVEQLSEGHVLAEKTGLGPENLHKFIETMFPGPYAAYSSRMLAGDYYKREEPLFAVDLARKDARHALDLAKKTGTNMPNVHTGDAHLVKVKEHLGEKGDLPSIYGAVRQESGLRFENKD
jgi:3-hydroxyisobutyrate dehydrogenase-like beta-hydroxyacid dehydrogenase